MHEGREDINRLTGVTYIHQARDGHDHPLCALYHQHTSTHILLIHSASGIVDTTDAEDVQIVHISDKH